MVRGGWLVIWVWLAGVGCCQCATARVDADALRVVKVENGGLLFTDNAAGVSGTDAGYSIPMGRQTLWLFGDVFLLDPASPDKQYIGAVSNCALVVPGGTGAGPLRRYTFLTDPATGVARQVLPALPGESKDLRFWPFGGWHNAAEDRVYLFYARVRVTGGGPLSFRVEGYGLAQADAGNPAALRFSRMAAQSGELWWTPAEGKPVFGCAVVAGPDKTYKADRTDRTERPRTSTREWMREPGGPDASIHYIYVVGMQERGRRKFGKLARAPRERAGDLRAYEYFAGGDGAPRWSRDIGDAADVEGLADFPNELSVAWNPYLGGFLAVHSVGLQGRARLSLAANPWGPYRSIGEIGTPRRALSSGFCYAGKEHPELAEGLGRIVYITYVPASGTGFSC